MQLSIFVVIQEKNLPRFVFIIKDLLRYLTLTEELCDIIKTGKVRTCFVLKSYFKCGPLIHLKNIQWLTNQYNTANIGKNIFIYKMRVVFLST